MALDINHDNQLSGVQNDHGLWVKSSLRAINFKDNHLF